MPLNELNHEGPIMIHIKTEKGKGYKFAEKSEDKFHGVSKFNINTGDTRKNKIKCILLIPKYLQIHF